MLKSILVAAIASTAFVGVAYARDPIVTIKLEAPVAGVTRVIASDTIWNCEGDTCVARPTHSVNVRACRQFAREAGIRVTSYGSEADALNADDLARCNGDAATQQARN